MSITPLSTRVITDVYEVGTRALEIARKTHICFLTNAKAFDDFIKSNKQNREALDSAYEKLNRLIENDDWDQIKETFTTEERLLWSFATQNYISSIKSSANFYEGETLSIDFYKNTISACEEALLIEDKMDNKSILSKTLDTFLKDVGHAIVKNNMSYVDEIMSFIQYQYSVKEYLSSYSDFTFVINNEELRFYDTYGDENDSLLYKDSDREKEAVALGIAIKYNGDIYCIDFSLENTKNECATYEVYKTNEPIGEHLGKRCFYHYRSRNKGDRAVSMIGYDGGYGKEDVEAKKAILSPRTLYQLYHIKSTIPPFRAGLVKTSPVE